MNSQLKPEEPFVLGNELHGYLQNKEFWIQYSDTENDVLWISSEREECEQLQIHQQEEGGGLSGSEAIDGLFHSTR